MHVIASAAGHLFELYANGSFPVFEAEWKPSWQISANKFSKKYYMLLQQLSKKASLFVNACDYDIEGSVIGYNIIRFFGDIKRAKRMKFSALTKDEILKAYNSMSELDYPYINAGIARHYVDWLWGINVSRFLMRSLHKVSKKRITLSAGRVQTPTLYEVISKEFKRETYVPEPYFRIKLTVTLGSIPYSFTLSKIFENKKDAEKVAELLKKGYLEVVKVERINKTLERPPPFNLGDLQAEAGRIFGFSPYKTERVAEELYLEGLISYPRTNSQKIPPSVNVEEIIKELGKGPYGFLVSKLNSMVVGGRYLIKQGKEEDPAHPAIYPTGEKPGKITKDALKLYELIVRRFLASASRDAIINSIKVVTRVHPLEYVEELNFQSVVNPGWLSIYTYTQVKSFQGYIDIKEGTKIPISKVSISLEISKPEARYTKVSLLKWMEKVGIGTEATRGNIIEILFKRKYLSQKGKYIYPTPLGISIVNVLKENFPELVSVKLTTEMENMLKDVQRGKIDKDQAIELVKRKLSEYFTKYSNIEEKIGLALAKPLGLVKYEKCEICELEAFKDKLCEWHFEALKNLKEKINLWKIRTGYSEGVIIKKLYKSSATGIYTKEVIKKYFLDDVSHAN